MEGPPESRSPRAPRPRRAPVMLLLVTAAVLVLLGRGLGWLGGGDDGDDAANRSPTRPRFVEGDRAPTTTPAPAGPASPARPDAESAPMPAAAPAMQTSAPPGERTVPPPRSAPAPGTGIEADRFASIRSLITTRTESGHLGEALAAIDRAKAMPLSGAQLEALAELRDAAEAAVDRRIEEIGTTLRAGHVADARTAAADLLAAAPASLHRRLLVGLGAPANDDAGRSPVADERPWPVPAALAKDRVVRTSIAGRTVTGRVVDSRSDEVTLRVKDDEDVTFPTVRVVDCEPANVTAGEAIELGLAALHAKDALLARLWLACARVRGGDSDEGRTKRLAELLK